MKWLGGMALPFAVALIAIAAALIAVNVLVTQCGA